MTQLNTITAKPWRLPMKHKLCNIDYFKPLNISHMILYLTWTVYNIIIEDSLHRDDLCHKNTGFSSRFDRTISAINKGKETRFTSQTFVVSKICMNGCLVGMTDDRKFSKSSQTRKTNQYLRNINFDFVNFEGKRTACFVLTCLIYMSRWRKASECFIGDGRMNEQPNVRIAVNSRSFRAWLIK